MGALRRHRAFRRKIWEKEEGDTTGEYLLFPFHFLRLLFFSRRQNYSRIWMRGGGSPGRFAGFPLSSSAPGQPNIVRYSFRKFQVEQNIETPASATPFRSRKFHSRRPSAEGARPARATFSLSLPYSFELPPQRQRLRAAFFSAAPCVLLFLSLPLVIRRKVPLRV